MGLILVVVQELLGIQEKLKKKEQYSSPLKSALGGFRTPRRAHDETPESFLPGTHTLGTLRPAGVGGGTVHSSPAAVPQAKDAKAPVGDGARRRLGGGLVGESGDYHRHQRHGI